MKKLIWGTPEYKKVHREIQKNRGSASEHSCVDCNGPAKDWCHRFDTEPTNVLNYDPRCQSCHRKYDYKHYGNHTAKLSDDQVRSIREKYAKGYTRKEIASEYGIAESTAANVALGIKYKNVS